MYNLIRLLFLSVALVSSAGAYATGFYMNHHSNNGSHKYWGSEKNGEYTFDLGSGISFDKLSLGFDRTWDSKSRDHKMSMNSHNGHSLFDNVKIDSFFKSDGYKSGKVHFNLLSSLNSKIKGLLVNKISIRKHGDHYYVKCHNVPIPEPSTYLLLGTCLLFVAYRRQKVARTV